jgi:hypothetical protein
MPDETPVAPRTDLGQLYLEVESLSEQGRALFNQYESQENVNEMAEYADLIAAHAYRIGAALRSIGEGLAQL